jgi:hypothetical protein
MSTKNDPIQADQRRHPLKVVLAGKSPAARAATSSGRKGSRYRTEPESAPLSPIGTTQKKVWPLIRWIYTAFCKLLPNKNKFLSEGRDIPVRF